MSSKLSPHLHGPSEEEVEATDGDTNTIPLEPEELQTALHSLSALKNCPTSAASCSCLTCRSWLAAGRRARGEDSGFQLEKFTLSVKIQRYVYHYVYYTEMCVVRMHNPSIALGNEILYYIEGWPYLRGVFVMYLGLSKVAFTEGGVLTSRVAFKRGSTILCSENFYRGGWGVLTSRVAFKRGSTLLCSENLYRGGVGCPHVKGGL